MIEIVLKKVLLQFGSLGININSLDTANDELESVKMLIIGAINCPLVAVFIKCFCFKI